MESSNPNPDKHVDLGIGSIKGPAPATAPQFGIVKDEISRVLASTNLELPADFSDFKELPALKTEGREHFAKNIAEYLNYFCDEMIGAGKIDAGQLKGLLLQNYEKVKRTAKVSINVNIHSLESIIIEGNIKHLMDVEAAKKRRSRMGIAGQESTYLERRKAKDLELRNGQKFIIGALASDNGYDEFIGPAPFYGHGVMVLNYEKLKDKIVFYAGDSMTNSNIIQEVMPAWIMKKWESPKSRKLDFEAAIFMKAMMETYFQLSGLSHINNFYVEAHIASSLNLNEDIEEIYYGVVDRTKEPHDNLFSETDEHKNRYENDDDYRGFIDTSREIKLEELSKKISHLSSLNQLQAWAGRSQQIQIRYLDKRIKTRERKWREGWQYDALTKDQLF